MRSEDKIKHLLNAIEDVYPSDRVLIWKSFLKGVFIGLGTTIGASIVIAILTFTLNKLKLIPVLKDIITGSNVERIFPENR